MKRNEDGSVTFNVVEFRELRAAWNDVTGILNDMPSSIHDFLAYNHDIPFVRYRKYDTLLNGDEWEGAQAYLINDYGEEEAENYYSKFFYCSPEAAERLLDPGEEDDA